MYSLLFFQFQLFYLINCIHFIHFVLLPCVYLLNGGGQGTASWCRESVRVGSSPTMFYVLHYSLCSTFLGCNVFSDTRGIVPNGNGWNIGVLCWYHSLCCSFLNLLWTTTDPCFSFFYAKRVQLSPFFFACPMFFIKDYWRWTHLNSLGSFKVLISDYNWVVLVQSWNHLWRKDADVQVHAGEVCFPNMHISWFFSVEK